MQATHRYRLTALLLLLLLPFTLWAHIPTGNAHDVIKRNKVSYVKLQMCDGGGCYTTENRFDNRGNHVYGHLLRTSSGSIQIYNDLNQCIKTGWGIWGMPDSTIEYQETYTYDSCGQEITVVYLPENDTVRYENFYGPDCRLIKVVKLTGQGHRVIEEHLYDWDNRLFRSSYRDKSTIFLYDAYGNKIKETEYKNGKQERETRYYYDHKNRLVQVEITPGHKMFKLDCETQLFTYDNQDRIKRHYEFFGDPCVGGFYMDLEYEYLPNGLLAGAYWHGKKQDGLIIEYLYEYH